MNKNINRRHFIKTIAAGAAALTFSCDLRKQTSVTELDPIIGKKLFLLRYDTEHESPEKMAGFFEKAIEVHRKHQIPATFFCKGRAIEKRKNQFAAFYQEIKNDPLFDIQDHSYSHIGIGYAKGKDVPTLKADYEKSFALHEQLFGARPIGISICGTRGKDGPKLSGFDATEKSRAELDMLASLGVRMVNSFLTGFDETKVFLNYSSLGHPEIMGFPSAYSDTSWLHRRKFGDPIKYIFSQCEKRAQANEHMPLMLHDWAAWTRADDKELTHVIKITDFARKLGYQLTTHVACLKQKALWA